MNQPTVSMSPAFRAAVAVLSALTVLSALGLIGVSFTQRPPAWFLILFEVPVLIAGAFGLLLAKGSRFGGVSGPAMTLLCIAGCVGAGSLMGYVGTGRAVAGMSLTKVMVGLAALAAAFGVLSALHVLLRKPALSFPLLLKGVLFGLPLPIVAFCAMRGIGQAQYQALPEVAQIVLALLGMLLVGGLICACVHLVVRAFQVCLEDPA
ncbi:MAG: hypothetical protein ACREJO_01355 [Phycisphaerales bacterium]